MNIVILAAGMGKRMRSALPKVLHLLAGKPLLSHVIDTARSLRPATLSVVYGHGGDAVPTLLAAPDLTFIKQDPQLGTGHAVMQALPYLNDATPTLILYGDVPLIRNTSLNHLITTAGTNALGILTVILDDPTGYGRIVRHPQTNDITHIAEQKDATSLEQAINEINTGIMIAPTEKLRQWLSTLSNSNAQNEYYLTDIVARAAADHTPIVSTQPVATWEPSGVNDKVQLAELERIYQRDQAHQLLEQGVTLADPHRLDIRGALTCGNDTTIDVGCLFEGQVTLGHHVTVGAYCIIKDAHIADHAEIKPFSHIDGATVGSHSVVGPYARLRPGTQLAESVHVGNFVEIKNSTIAAHSKANHLSYLGDATIGSRVNIGAGTTTCNYDGANKFQTIIEDDAFIGSDSQLVAPVRVGKGATVGAGTTLTKDAPEHALTLTRSKQIHLHGWQRPVKIKK